MRLAVLTVGILTLTAFTSGCLNQSIGEMKAGVMDSAAIPPGAANVTILGHDGGGGLWVTFSLTVLGHEQCFLEHQAGYASTLTRVECQGGV